VENVESMLNRNVFFYGNLNAIMHLDDKILLKSIIKGMQYEGRYWNKPIPNGREQVPCEHGNKYSN
jgi:hypothetical protein